MGGCTSLRARVRAGIRGWYEGRYNGRCKGRYKGVVYRGECTSLRARVSGSESFLFSCAISNISRSLETSFFFISLT